MGIWGYFHEQYITKLAPIGFLKKIQLPLQLGKRRAL